MLTILAPLFLPSTSNWTLWPQYEATASSGSSRKVFGALNIKKTLADDEIDYVFSMLEGERHCGHFNQFEVPKNFWTDVLKHDKEIRKDRPALYEKMADIRMYKEQGKF